MRATRSFAPFIDRLSNWYIRRSRKRFWKSEDDTDKNNAYRTLSDVLVTLSKLMAPFTPFIAEEIYKNLTEEESVHRADYPVANESLIDEKLNRDMNEIRSIVTQGLQLRAEAKIKVRQPLSGISIKRGVSGDFETIMREELNVKSIFVDENQGETIVLDTTLTPELKLEGQAREIIRCIQEARKEAGFDVSDRIAVGYQGLEHVFDNSELKAIIAHEVLAERITEEYLDDFDIQKGFIIDRKSFAVSLKKRR
jgi:isoleucyl-tRNA synthetase